MMNSGASHQRKQSPRRSQEIHQDSIRTLRCISDSKFWSHSWDFGDSPWTFPFEKWTMACSFYSEFAMENGPFIELSIKLVIFHSYVSLPEGNLQQIASSRRKSVGHMKTMGLSLALSRGPMVASFFFGALNDKFLLGCPNLASPRTSYAMMNGPTLW